ncbi:MAG TPA: L-threonylcarbamoyladenylate synthase [Treponemataceae bacterium]|nr:L-threonylcarbamoyladenylate synthase [Treponemataceae bacterium]
MRIDKKSPNSNRKAADCLTSGGIAILPTDTIYGFSGLVPGSSGKIHAIKGRDEGKPFIELIADASDLGIHCADAINPLLLAYWPGAVTIIVRNRAGGTTAYRCPGDEWLRSVIKLCGKPIYSTSVNRAGEPPIKKIDDICAAFGDSAELIVDDGDHEAGAPSTLIDATGPIYRVIRQGAVNVAPEALKAP